MPIVEDQSLVKSYAISQQISSACNIAPTYNFVQTSENLFPLDKLLEIKFTIQKRLMLPVLLKLSREKDKTIQIIPVSK
jgi:hypothetical protein